VIAQVAERSVEGRHARLTKLFKEAPHAGTAYASLSGRFKEFEKIVCKDPKANPARITHHQLAQIVFLFLFLFLL
jgi:hypothetical protein